ncbi:MAG: DUF5723 family protein [Bacteroidales bacterium]|nr:DUF5723 family protein [Bacteroidales bacterium]
MTHRYKRLATLLVALLPMAMCAQELRTAYLMHTSKNRHQMNPAYLLGQPYLGLPTLSNVYVGYQSTYGANLLLYPIKPKNPGDPTLGTFLHPQVSEADVLRKLGNKDLRSDVHVNYGFFSCAFNSFGGTNLVELNVRANASVVLPGELIRFAKQVGSRKTYSFSNLGVRSSAYVELALGHSRELDSHWTVGSKFKMLFGAGHAQARLNDVNVEMHADRWRVSGHATGRASIINAGLVADDEGDITLKTDAKHRAGLGFGVALDLGARYKVHGMENLELSAAITDLGFIRYGSGQHLATPHKTWEFAGFKDAYIASDKINSQEVGKTLEQMGDDLKDLAKFKLGSERGFTETLATTINLGAEYTLPSYKQLSFGLVTTHRFAGLHSWHQAMAIARVRPHKVVEVGVSGGLSTTGVTWGTMFTLQARRFQFFTGIEAHLSTLSREYIPTERSATSVNFGMTIPLGKN